MSQSCTRWHTLAQVPAALADAAYRYCYSQAGLDTRLRLLCDLRRAGWTEIVVKVELAAAGYPAVQGFHDHTGKLLWREEIREERTGLQAQRFVVGMDPCEMLLWTASGVPRLPVRLRTLIEHDLMHREYPLAWHPEQFVRYGAERFWQFYPGGEPACEVRNTFDANGRLLRHEEFDCGPRGLASRTVETFEFPDDKTMVRRLQEYMISPYSMIYRFDAHDRLTDVLEECQGIDPTHNRFTYSGQNAVEEVFEADVLGQRIEYVFSASGLILQKRYADDRGVVTSVASWLYDSHDRLMARRHDTAAKFF